LASTAVQELLLVELDFREQDNHGDALIGHQTAGGGDPAGVPAHHLNDEDLRRGLGHGTHVIGGLQSGHGDVLGDRAEAGAAVGDGQVVVHGLGHVDGLDGIAHGFGQLAHLVAGVRRVAAAVVEEVADVVGLEDLDQAFVFALVGFQRLQLETTGAEGAGRRRTQRGDGRVRFLAGIDQLLGQRADDAIAAGVDLADDIGMLARGLDDAAGGGVDDGGDAAGLSVKGILFPGHRWTPMTLCKKSARQARAWYSFQGASESPAPDSAFLN
jgi:hypothetical protein